MGDAAEKWSKAERLAVAGVVAPHLRDQSERAARRRVTKLDKDGNVVGYTTLAEVQRALLERQRIEIAVVDGSRPKDIVCEKCGRLQKISPKGVVPKLCEPCRNLNCAECGIELPKAAGTPWAHRKRRGKPATCRECATKLKPRASCADCGVELGYHAISPSAVRRRNGEPARCKTCSGSRIAKTVLASRTPESRTKGMKKAWERRRKAGTDKQPAQRCGECNRALPRNRPSRPDARCLACANKPDAYDRRAAAKRAWATRRANKATDSGGTEP